jgi:hypothetical protein
MTAAISYFDIVDLPYRYFYFRRAGIMTATILYSDILFQMLTFHLGWTRGKLAPRWLQGGMMTFSNSQPLT